MTCRRGREAGPPASHPTRARVARPPQGAIAARRRVLRGAGGAASGGGGARRRGALLGEGPRTLPRTIGAASDGRCDARASANERRAVRSRPHQQGLDAGGVVAAPRAAATAGVGSQKGHLSAGQLSRPVVQRPLLSGAIQGSRQSARPPCPRAARPAGVAAGALPHPLRALGPLGVDDDLGGPRRVDCGRSSPSCASAK